MPNLPFMLVWGCYYSAVGIWLGMMVMIAAGAPVVFRLLPQKSLAGGIVGAWLGVYYKAGLACALVTALAVIFRVRMAEHDLWRQAEWTPQRVIAAVRYALIALMILNHLYAGWSLDPEIHRIRQQVPGEISALAADDLARLAFDALHKRSVMLMGANLLSGVAVIFLS